MNKIFDEVIDLTHTFLKRQPDESMGSWHERTDAYRGLVIRNTAYWDQETNVFVSSHRVEHASYVTQLIPAELRNSLESFPNSDRHLETVFTRAEAVRKAVAYADDWLGRIVTVLEVDQEVAAAP